MLHAPPVKTYTLEKGVTFAAPFAEVVRQPNDADIGMSTASDILAGWSLTYVRLGTLGDLSLVKGGRNDTLTSGLVGVLSGLKRFDGQATAVRPRVYQGRLALEMDFTSMLSVGVFRIIEGEKNLYFVGIASRQSGDRAILDSVRLPEPLDPTAEAALLPVWRPVADPDGTVRAEIPGEPTPDEEPGVRTTSHFTRVFAVSLAPVGSAVTDRALADKFAKARGGRVTARSDYRANGTPVSSFQIKLGPNMGRVDVARVGGTVVCLGAGSLLGPLESPETGRFFGQLRAKLPA